jgi:hypothetical protein
MNRVSVAAWCCVGLRAGAVGAANVPNANFVGTKSLGNFGVRNDHYIFDNATFELPLGLMLLAAVRWPAWRVPALAFATLHWGLHALSHIIDPHHGAGDWIGWLEAGGLVVTTALLALALRTSVIAERGGNH